MSTLAYFSLCLTAALIAVGILSFAITRRRQWRGVRRGRAERMMAALGRYSAWLASQRHAGEFHGEGAEAAEALDEACTIRLAVFPELAGDMAELLAVHNRLLAFLATQHTLRFQDPEAWLESDHDGRFVALWRQHRFALQAIEAKLRLLGALDAPASPAQSTFA